MYPFGKCSPSSAANIHIMILLLHIANVMQIHFHPHNMSLYANAYASRNLLCYIVVCYANICDVQRTGLPFAVKKVFCKKREENGQANEFHLMSCIYF